MLKPPRIAGAAQLRALIDDLSFDYACRVIDVHASTMRRWLRDDPAPPQAALQALYWLSKYGYSAACAEAHWSHQYLICRVRELETTVRQLRELRDNAPRGPKIRRWRPGRSRAGVRAARDVLGGLGGRILSRNGGVTSLDPPQKPVRQLEALGAT